MRVNGRSLQYFPCMSEGFHNEVLFLISGSIEIPQFDTVG